MGTEVPKRLIGMQRCGQAMPGSCVLLQPWRYSARGTLRTRSGDDAGNIFWARRRIAERVHGETSVINGINK